ncbi:hypothetical protein FGB62_32g133 [Gracilaria domingensis]|nr:hypothetical protein FGB62_32g133 [Gracilaria domingensis]
MVLHSSLLQVVCICSLAALVQPRLQSQQDDHSTSTSTSKTKLLNNLGLRDAGKDVSYSHHLDMHGECGNIPFSVSEAKEARWEGRAKAIQTLGKTDKVQRNRLGSVHITQPRKNSFANVILRPSAQTETRQMQMQMQSLSTPLFAEIAETTAPRSTSRAVSSAKPVSTVAIPSASNGISTQAIPSSPQVIASVASLPSSSATALLPSLTSSFSPSAAYSVDANAPIASKAPQWTSSFSPHLLTVEASASPSFSRTATPLISVSTLPSPSAFPSKEAEGSAAPSQSMRPSEIPSETSRVLPEVSPNIETGDETKNQTEHLAIGESVVVSMFSHGPLLNRIGYPVNDTQFSDVLIILSMNNSRHDEMPIIARQESLNISESVVTVKACANELIKNEESKPTVSLHAFERSTLGEADLIVSRGFQSSFQYNETHTCLMGLTLEIPSSTFGTVYLVLSQRLSPAMAVVEMSAVKSSNSIGTAPLVWNRDLLSIPEKANVSLDAAEKAKVFVISSWPNVHHVELRDMRVDSSGLRHMYGSTSRFPNPICDESGTQLVTSIVGKHLGIGPNEIAAIPVPVQNCEDSYSLDVILSALAFVSKTVEVSSSLNAFVVFDDRLQESGFLSDSRLQKELEGLASAGVLTFIPRKVCHEVEPSYIAVELLAAVLTMMQIHPL